MTDGVSMINQPIWFGIIGPKPRRACLPYGALTKNKKMKTAVATTSPVNINAICRLSWLKVNSS
jgi:hypothetical protein